MLDDEALPRLLPELREAERVAYGPWHEDLDVALGAGLVSTSDDESVEVVSQVDHQRRTYALFTTPSRAPRPRGASQYDAPVALWLGRVESRADPMEGTTVLRRVSAIRLYDGAVTSEGMNSPEYECTVASELRARDVDGDGEVEITVLAQYFHPVEEEDEECGTLGFLVGGDDMNVQARFTRQYHFFQSDAGGDIGDKRQTTWQFRDVDADGHADLHVTEAWQYADDFMGDDIGGGETAGPSHERGRDRRELDCLWIAAEDVWRCPQDQPAPGRTLFVQGSERRVGRRPW